MMSLIAGSVENSTGIGCCCKQVNIFFSTGQYEGLALHSGTPLPMTSNQKKGTLTLHTPYWVHASVVVY